MRRGVLMILALLIFTFQVSAEELKIVGTGAGMSVLEEIAADFMKSNRGVKVIVPTSIGSSGGIDAVGTDKEKIGRVSRRIKDNEKKYGLSYTEIAKIPIVFYVHPSVKLTNLKDSQIVDIYSGKITNWKQVGGADLPIVVVRREKGDSSLDVLSESLAGFALNMITTKALTRYTDSDTVDFVVKTKGAIAFGTYANAARAAVTILSLNNVQPKANSYPHKNTLALIYKESNLVGKLKAFVSFATSAKASAAIKRMHGIPLK